MIRLILLIIIILLVLWILRPFLGTKDSNKNKDTLNSISDPEYRNLRQRNTVLIIIGAVILFVLVVWLLPKFGINSLALLQKIIPIISSLRSILPF